MFLHLIKLYWAPPFLLCCILSKSSNAWSWVLQHWVSAGGWLAGCVCKEPIWDFLSNFNFSSSCAACVLSLFVWRFWMLQGFVTTLYNWPFIFRSPLRFPFTLTRADSYSKPIDVRGTCSGSSTSDLVLHFPLLCRLTRTSHKLREEMLVGLCGNTNFVLLQKWGKTGGFFQQNDSLYPQWSCLSQL